MLVAGRYIVEAVQAQVVLHGPAGREIWLGSICARGGAGRVEITGWIKAGCRVVSCRGGPQTMLTGLQG